MKEHESHWLADDEVNFLRQVDLLNLTLDYLDNILKAVGPDNLYSSSAMLLTSIAYTLRAPA